MSGQTLRSHLVLTEQERETQRDYAEKAKMVLLSRYAPCPKALVRTYGCQQNVSDSERIKGLLETMGYGFTDNLDQADLVLYNTCAVREHAEDRVYGNVGKLKAYKRERGDAVKKAARPCEVYIHIIRYQMQSHVTPLYILNFLPFLPIHTS